MHTPAARGNDGGTNWPRKFGMLAFWEIIHILFDSLENIYAPVSVAGASDWTDQHLQKINYTAKFRKTQGEILLLTTLLHYAKSKRHRRFNVAYQTERRQFRPYFDYKLKKANQFLYYWFVNYLISLFIFHVCLEIFKIKKKWNNELFYWVILTPRRLTDIAFKIGPFD